MTLADVYNNTMSEILSKCVQVKQHIQTDDSGVIQYIELTYVPKSDDKDYGEPASNSKKIFGR